MRENGIILLVEKIKMLAIVIPYFKIKFFEDCLLSLKNQVNKDFVVYIGNDASLDDPSEILEVYSKFIKIIYLRFGENLGGTSLVSQWSRCIDLVGNQEWIMVLGDDDKLGPGCVDQFYHSLDQMKKNDISVVRFATKIINSRGQIISQKYVHPQYENSKNFLFRKLKGNTRSSLSEYIFKKEIVLQEKFKDFPLAWYSDLLAVMEFSKFGKIFSINEEVVYFRLSGLNITSKNDNLLEKNLASFKFYYYLLNEKRTEFEQQQKEFLFHYLEKTFLNNKKNLDFWFKLTKLYLSQFYLKRYLIFLRKVQYSVLNR